MEFDLELDKAVSWIEREKAKIVCIQLPDGLKPKAKEIQEKIKENSKAKVIIWGSSCFGGCDVPLEVERLGVDLLIQWGHRRWNYAKS